MIINSGPTTVKNSDANNINSPSLTLKPSANLSLLFNQLNDFSPEQKNDTDQFQTFKFPELSKNFDDLENLLKCTNKVFDIAAVSETRLTKKIH